MVKRIMASPKFLNARLEYRITRLFSIGSRIRVFQMIEING